ncbi:unnamed protein product [Ambrosiozyma monospora]|uniref:Unnamed protein product n=1 Tax=Ambrosiozyma monospora TaxID=43982 RepID=A0ACB5TB09_AMBMO|nr:unnamed protein product [Ambrosiozyma monospora]
MLKLLWPQNDVSFLDPDHRNFQAEINIPTYKHGLKEDSIELQIRSLLYIYKKFKIYKLDHFVDTSDNIADDYIEFTYACKQNQDQVGSTSMSRSNNRSESYLINDKLDSIYNVHNFKKMFLDDPYRILIDFPKNKFRSMMILSDKPKDFGLPMLNDDFKFQVLQADSLDDEYRSVILNSPIYKEHEIDYDIKLKILNKVLAKQRDEHPEGFDKDIRHKIIRTYLIKLAFHIQVIRLFKTTVPEAMSEEQKEEFHINVKNAVRVRVKRESFKLSSHPTL